MFSSQDPAPASSGKRTATIIAVVLVLGAVVAAIALVKPSFLGFGIPANRNAPDSKRPDDKPGLQGQPSPTDSDTPEKDQVAVLETTAGRIVIEFLPQYAPKHTLAFQNMFRAGFFDQTVFYRIVPKRAIQGGDPNSKDDNPFDDGLGQEWQRRIPAEISTKLRHGRGTVSAARLPSELDSATSQFFICTREARDLDGQFTIFGRVIDGMDVVDKIATAPLRTDDTRLRERPVDPVRITKGFLESRDKAMHGARAPKP